MLNCSCRCASHSRLLGAGCRSVVRAVLLGRSRRRLGGGADSRAEAEPSRHRGGLGLQGGGKHRTAHCRPLLPAQGCPNPGASGAKASPSIQSRAPPPAGTLRLSGVKTGCDVKSGMPRALNRRCHRSSSSSRSCRVCSGGGKGGEMVHRLNAKLGMHASSTTGRSRPLPRCGAAGGTHQLRQPLPLPLQRLALLPLAPLRAAHFVPGGPLPGGQHGRAAAGGAVQGADAGGRAAAMAAEKWGELRD